jgi:hypothetical protein
MIQFMLSMTYIKTFEIVMACHRIQCYIQKKLSFALSSTSFYCMTVRT